MYIYVCVSECIYACVCVYAYIYVYVYVYMYIYICVCVCVCMYVYMSQNGQALPRINYHDPPHLNTNHSHLHLITTAITTLIRAPVSVHSVVRSCGATRTATLLNHLPEYTYLNTLPAITYLLFASHFQIPGKLWTLETFGLFGISVCSAPAKDTEAQSESQHTLHYTFKKDQSPHLKKFTTVVIEFAFNKHLLFKHPSLCQTVP